MSRDPVVDYAESSSLISNSQQGVMPNPTTRPIHQPSIIKGGNLPMKESQFTSYDQLPLFLNATLVARTLGVSISSAYELMHEDGFPSLRIGSRFVVPKEKFRQWVEQQTGGKN